MSKEKLTRLLDRLVRDKRGNIAFLYALALLPLSAAAGVAVDYAQTYTERVSLQSALDLSVLAGATANNSSTVAASTFAAQNVSSVGTITGPTYSAGSDGSFTGTVTSNVATTILPVIGISSIAVTATATAARKSGNNVCILLVDKSASQAFLVNGGADLSAPNCEIDAASTGWQAAVFNAGSTITSTKICLAGTSILDNGGSHANMSTGCTVISDPFAGTLPTPSTTSANCYGGNYNGGSVTLSPGVYCGGYNFNSAPNVTFNPGVYVIKGGWWVVDGGTWTGTDVTFYFADSSGIQFNSGVKATLSAPTSGTYSGILMYEASGLPKSSFVLDVSKGHTLTGLIYLPSREMTFNSGANATVDQMTMVLDTLTLDSMTWKLDSATTTMSSAAGSSAYLVK